MLHYIVDKRLERGRLTVVDATNVKAEDRKGLLELARRMIYCSRRPSSSSV